MRLLEIPFGIEARSEARRRRRRAVPSTSVMPLSRDRVAFLTADGQVATPLEQEAVLGTNDLLEASFLDRCLLVRNCVGRVRFSTPQGRSYATGFLVAPGILLTNHHVFGSAAAARGSSVEFDYRFDAAGQLPAVSNQFDLAPERFFVANSDLDFAAVAVGQTSTTGQPIAARGYLRLIAESGKARFGEYVTIIQHPDGEPMRIALRENKIVRLEPDEPFITYEADTAHGSSGSPVFNDSLQLVALHASGRIRRNAAGQYALANGSFTDSLEGLGEKDVLWDNNVGFRISRIAPALLAGARSEFPEEVPRLDAAMRGGDVLGEAVAADTETPANGVVAEENEEMTDNVTPVAAGSAAGELVVPLELRISVNLRGEGPAVAVAGGGAETALQAEAFPMRIPIIYDEIEDRPGFDRNFLGLAGPAPMPKLTSKGRANAAPLIDGSGLELRYRHFSVWMHRRRRLALFTASNVDWRTRPDKVEGKSTHRKPLAGFPEKPEYAEQWVNDERISAAHQLPDIFYSEDRGAFDKGHLVRRDDVCWGSTYQEIQMANGDTYHVTNCSPQIKPFNQGQYGVENWGDFETHVQKATKKDQEKAIIYAGPVFGAADRWFRGKDDNGSTRVQIPSRYWKIVVVKGVDGPEAYGFTLDQDVTPVTEKEFFVTEEWKGSMKRIREIQSQLRGWVSLTELIPYDKYDSVHGS